MLYYLLYYFLYVIHHHILYYYYLYSICEINNFISLIILHRSLFKLIIKNCKRIILSQSVNLLMISVTTPLSIGDLCDSGSVHLYGFPGITTH